MMTSDLDYPDDPGLRHLGAMLQVAESAEAFSKLGHADNFYARLPAMADPMDGNQASLVDDPGPLGQCFTTCGRWAMEDQDMTYVEGMALADHGGRPSPILVHHAWIEDPDGTIWEPTWPEPGWSYFGVRFPPICYAMSLQKANTWDILHVALGLRAEQIR